MTRFPDPDFAPPSPPFHVPHTVLYTKYPSKSCSSVVGGREKRARAFSRVSCACTAKHTRKESEAPGYADPSGTDFAPESSAVCFRFHCRSIDLQYLEETFPLLGFSVRSWMVGWKRSLAKQREEVVTGGDQVS